MSAYTTIYITVSKAKQEIINHVAADASFYDLEVMLSHILRDKLYDVVVVPNGEENNDDSALGK